MSVSLVSCAELSGFYASSIFCDESEDGATLSRRERIRCNTQLLEILFRSSLLAPLDRPSI